MRCCTGSQCRSRRALLTWSRGPSRPTSLAADLVIKFRMDTGRGNGNCCFEIEMRTDTAKVTNTVVARFSKCKKYDHRNQGVH